MGASPTVGRNDAPLTIRRYFPPDGNKNCLPLQAASGFFPLDFAVLMRSVMRGLRALQKNRYLHDCRKAEAFARCFSLGPKIYLDSASIQFWVQM
jgi:hypothetical protein